MELNIVKLIENTPMTQISSGYQHRLIEKVKETFSEHEQHLFLASFYCYLNYNSKTDFVINMDNIWKWTGFSRKDPAKRLLEKHFIQETDYKVFLQSVENLEGGRPSEQIMLTINTFKKFCLKAGTKKADEIHNYYIKLEELLQETIKEENEELRNRLEESNTKLKDSVIQLKETSTQLKETSKKLKTSQDTMNRILGRKYSKAEPGQSVYLYRDNFSENSFFKFGQTKNLTNREKRYTDSNKTGNMVHHKYCLDCQLSEKVIHHIADKYRRFKNQEWFDFRDQNFGIAVIDVVTTFLDGYIDDIENFIPFMKYIFKNKTSLEKTDDYLNYYNNEYTKEDEAEYQPNENTDFQENQEEVTIEPVERSEIIEHPVVESIKKEKSIVKKAPKTVKSPRYSSPPTTTATLDTSSIVNPLDFEKFMKECVDFKEDYICIQTDLRKMYRIWCKGCITKDSENRLREYLESNYKSTWKFIDHSRRHIFLGFRVRKLTFTPSEKIQDWERFVQEECAVDLNYSISHLDFFTYFKEWKQKYEPNFTLTPLERSELTTEIEKVFSRCRTYSSETSNTKHLYGFCGIGKKGTNMGVIEAQKRNKEVGEYSIDDGKLLRVFDSVSKGSGLVGVSFSTFGAYIRNQTVVGGKIYKLLEKSDIQ